MRWANLAEQYIEILISAVINKMNHTDCPIVFLDYCIEYKMDSINLYMQTTGEE